MTFSSFQKFTGSLPDQEEKMPLLFVGHGSPMNGIEDNEFSQRWQQMAKEVPQPEAVLVVSAHWFTRGTHITAMDHPSTIHDFGGFPPALSEVQYPAPGNPQLAKETATLFQPTPVGLDHEWGLDHGTWSVVRHMYPKADIPVLQLSIDFTKGGNYHYELAKQLSTLRKKKVLIIGSGNMVHNLRLISWEMIRGGGYDWAIAMNERLKKLILDGDHAALANFEGLGKEGKLAIPTPEHYLPLLYILALQEKNETIAFFNDKAIGGSLTMTSLKIG
ncbi:4,5-DOPA-extradiol-dioxygenase [Flavitalea flava]